jgi:4-hydroxybutyrate dehydrogenase
LAQALGLPGCDRQGNEVADAVTAMNARLGLPTGLRALGVNASNFEKIIDGAMADHCHKTGPRLATRDDYKAMLHAAMQ